MELIARSEGLPVSDSMARTVRSDTSARSARSACVSPAFFVRCEYCWLLPKHCALNAPCGNILPISPNSYPHHLWVRGRTQYRPIGSFLPVSLQTPAFRAMLVLAVHGNSHRRNCLSASACLACVQITFRGHRKKKDSLQ